MSMTIRPRTAAGSRRRLVAAGEPAGRLQAVDIGHLDVHQHDVRMTPANDLEDLRAVASLTDDLDVGLGIEDEPQPRADHLLVVGQHDPDRRIRPGRAGRERPIPVAAHREPAGRPAAATGAVIGRIARTA